MKRTTAVLIGMSLASMAGVACAGDDTLQQPLRPVTVQSKLPFAWRDRPLGGCTPPPELAACDDLHALIRNVFNPKEISMLFGAASSHAEYLTSYDRVRARYARFLRDYEAGYYPVALVSK